jgi:hypothetical protein
MSGGDRSSRVPVCKLHSAGVAINGAIRAKLFYNLSFPYIRERGCFRLAGVPESDPTSPLKREDLLSKLDELRAQSRRYIGELNRINEEVERLQERLSDLSPDARARGGNAAAYPKEQHGAA